jgi:N-acetylmuramoyl-L-alanine amidase
MPRRWNRASIPVAAWAVGLFSTVTMAATTLRTAIIETGSGPPTLILDLSAPVQPHVFVLDSPYRVVIDLPHTRRAASLGLPEPAGPVRATRGAARGSDGYRVVLELAERPLSAPRVDAAGTPGGYELKFALGAVPQLAQPAPTPAAAEPPAIRIVQPRHGPGRLGRDIVVAIDAGHGGEDPGASGPAGTHEKEVTLAIARSLAAQINGRPGMRAVLTRDSDRLIDLRERFERARTAHADIFVSIHADSVRDRSIAGASVYTLSYHGASSEAARSLADHENALVLKGGVSLAGVSPDLRPVVLDVVQSQNMGLSVEAADEVLGALDGVGAVRKRIVQHAGFMVLKSPDVPSMLVETAYISNPAEERNLRSHAYQERLARAIAVGLIAYFQRHPPDGTQYADARRSGEKVTADSGV